MLGDVRDVEERRRILLEVLGLHEQRLRLGADDVGELVHRVERRLGRAARLGGGGDDTLIVGRRFAAARTAWPERRTSAPADAPERSNAPTTSARIPTIVAPGPSSAPRPPPKTQPRKPPCAVPSVVSRPKVRKASPIRNGRKSTSSLRATMSEPTATNASGTRYAAAPTKPWTPSESGPPTIPPSQPP